MTTLAAMYAELDALRAATAAPEPDPFVPELPPAAAPHGPNAARQQAQHLADMGEHSHLHAYGETVCLSHQCHAGPDTLQGLL